MKLGAFAVIAAIGLAACSSSADTSQGGDGSAPADASTAAAGADQEAVPAGTVTFDGSTCSLEITAGTSGPEATFEPGVVVFEVVNATERPAQFDSWEILEGYSFGSFEAVLERGLRRLDAGKRGLFPEVGQEILYVDNESVPANGSGIASVTLAPGKEYAMTCLQRVEGQGVFSWGPVGPITVG